MFSKWPHTFPFAILATIIVLANGFVCFTYFTARNLRTVTNKFVISLAICDILIGTVYIPFQIIHYEEDPRTRNQLLGPISYYVSGFAGFGVLFNLVALTYERYVAIFLGLRYFEVMNHRKVKMIMVIAWSATILVTFIPLGWQFTEKNKQLQHIYQCILLTIVILVNALVLAIYIQIFKASHLHLSRLSRRLSEIANQKEPTDSGDVQPGDVAEMLGNKKVLPRSISVTSESSAKRLLHRNNNDSRSRMEVIFKSLPPSTKSHAFNGSPSTTSCLLQKSPSAVSHLSNGHLSTTSSMLHGSPPTVSRMPHESPSIVSRMFSGSPRKSCHGERRSSTRSSRKIFLMEVKATKIIAIIFLINCICWIPVIIINICDVISSSNFDEYLPKVLLTVSKYFFVINSAINPFIYGLCKRDFRKAIQRRFCDRKRRERMKAYI